MTDHRMTDHRRNARKWHDLMELVGRELDGIRTDHGQSPVRIRVTTAAVRGTLLVMPEDPEPLRREVRIHPDDWREIRKHVRDRAARPDGQIRELFGIPVVEEQ